MPVRPSTKRVLAVALLLGVAAVAALATVGPGIVPLDVIERRVHRHLTDRWGARATFELDVRLFPRPHLVVHDGVLEIPQRMQATIQRVALFPALRSLLAGRVEWSAINVHLQTLTVQLPDSADQRATTAAALAALLGGEPAAGSGRLAIDGHLQRVVLTGGGSGAVSRVFGPVTVAARRTASGTTGRIAARSDHWHRLTVHGRWQAGTGEGRIEIRDASLPWLQEWLQPAAEQRITAGKASLTIRYALAGFDRLQADVTVALPDLAVSRAGRVARLGPLTATASLTRTGTAVRVALDRMTCGQPHLDLDGIYWRQADQPRHRFELNARDVPVAPVAHFLEILAGPHPVVEKTGGILRDGTLTTLTARSAADAPGGLVDPQAFSLEARVADVRVITPKHRLRLENLNGAVTVTGDVLRITQAEARLGNSSGRNGTLEISVTGRDHPFHLAMDLDADVADLVPVLIRVVPHEKLRRELATITAISGRAQGRMVLDRHGERMVTRVTAHRMALRAQYPRLPHPVEITAGTLAFTPERISVSGLAGHCRHSRIDALEAWVDWHADPRVEISAARGRLSLEDVFALLAAQDHPPPVLATVPSATGAVDVSRFEGRFPLDGSGQSRYALTGRPLAVALTVAGLPADLHLDQGRLSADAHRVKFEKVRGRLLDADALLSGELVRPLERLEAAAMTFDGHLGPDASRWLRHGLGVSSRWRWAAPLSVRTGALDWQRTTGDWQLTAEVQSPSAVTVALEVTRTAQEVHLKRLHLRDDESLALVSTRISRGIRSMAFAGNLTGSTLNRLFPDCSHGQGWLKGDFEVRFPGPAQDWRVTGDLLAADLSVPLEDLLAAPARSTAPARLDLERIRLAAAQQVLTVHEAGLRVGGHLLNLSGTLRLVDSQVLCDLVLTTPAVSPEFFEHPVVAALRRTVNRPSAARDAHPRLTAKGRLNLQADTAAYRGMHWQSLRAEVLFEPGRVQAMVNEADWCGLTTSGTLTWTPAATHLTVTPMVRSRSLAPLIHCIWERDAVMTGEVTLSGNLTAHPGGGGLAREDVAGTLQAEANNGRIHRFNLLAKLFAVLNLTEIFRGNLPDLVEEGLAYRTITARMHLNDDVLRVEEAVLEGASLDLAVEGWLDLGDTTLDMKVLVAPLKTVDSIVRHLPLIRTWLAGSLVTIPLRVHGRLADPEVTPLPPSEVGARLIGLMKRTLELPIRIIQPILP